MDCEKSILLERAIAIALRAHQGQVDRSGGAYITHPLRMMAQTIDQTEQIVAVLHDAVEDGRENGVTLQSLEEAGFPPKVVDAVDALTRRTRRTFPELTHDESYEEFIIRAAENPIARAVKLLDLADNMDVRRLTEISAADHERLDRYRSAWRTLTGR